MKVLKPGDGRKGWAKELICTGDGNGDSGCGALLLVEQGDLFHTASHARDEITTYTTFRCPECGGNTDVQGVGRQRAKPKGIQLADGSWCHPKDNPNDIKPEL